MKLGAHIYLWMERWSDREVGLFSRAKALGLDTIELSVGLDVPYDHALTKRAAEDAGISLVVGPGGAWPDDADLAADDPAHRQSAYDFHRSVIDQTAEVGGICYAGALYGRPGKSLRRRPPADELARAAEGLRGLAAHAAGAGIILAIEPMSRFRSHLVNRPAQAVQLIELAGRPANLRVLIDTYHMITELRDPAAAIRETGDLLWGLHACENDRGVPGGGLVPWPEIFTALKTTPADYVAFEGYNTGPSTGDFGWFRGMFQNVCPDGDAFVRQGLDYIKPLLG
ncbi:MAG: sugar phosphate isomerase/epimerase [Cephaloticoccus sp.]|nr:sugar phosphate isomerase/epimerase [Cephaloticoccus sp.]